MLCPGKLNREDILSIDKAYIDYAKFAFRMAGQKAGCSRNHKSARTTMILGVAKENKG